MVRKIRDYINILDAAVASVEALSNEVREFIFDDNWFSNNEGQRVINDDKGNFQ